MTRIGLIDDNRRGDIERRRWDCAHLRACEVNWIADHGGEQGKCPLWCRAYEQAKPGPMRASTSEPMVRIGGE